MIFVAPVADLADSARHVVALRSWRSPAQHDSILVYRRDPPPGAPGAQAGYYSIANECPHLGLPLEGALALAPRPEKPRSDSSSRAGGDIEDLCDDDEIDPRKEPIVICPFHQFDFGLGSGSSSSGMHACTYRLEVRNGGELWMEPPGDLGDDYRVIGIRSVSERASSLPPRVGLLDPDSPSRRVGLLDPDPPLSHTGFADLPAAPTDLLSSLTLSDSPAVEPRTIVAYCRHVLLAPTPAAKVTLVRRLVSLFRSGTLSRLADPSTDPPHPLEPYRAPSVKTVASGQTGRLRRGGNIESRIRLLHALANIELWAIDLAIDHVARFHDGDEAKRLGWGFVSDFLKVAEDEAKCVAFSLSCVMLCVSRTQADPRPRPPAGTSPSSRSASSSLAARTARSRSTTVRPSLSLSLLDLPSAPTLTPRLASPAGLWESATQTSHSLLSRLAIVALVHEARGLDTNPTQIRRCRAAGDEETARVLEIVHADEICVRPPAPSRSLSLSLVRLVLTPSPSPCSTSPSATATSRPSAPRTAPSRSTRSHSSAPRSRRTSSAPCAGRSTRPTAQRRVWTASGTRG